ncbi:amino acid ABC transporter permease [Nocardioides guangzhouensis]|uniref:Amino acid ABC transporter permease n=1 Tax=Nocardioides guangzhouensis TaxID=2497878 RepID=A0A4Q4ZAA2_9ACTN|nr:amino acid ABC transporter permease [Nocardioides guangzhouensis]RYP84126.1 amino acid ABC transporter permease [Nocardioides guangzhouensis]
MASPRQRAARWRLVQYAVLAIVLVAALLLANWGELKRAMFDPDIIREQFPDVITVALKNTLIYTACGFTFGLALGLVLALMRLSSVGPYRWIATGVIELFRGLPALVVFLALSVGVPLAFPDREIPFGNLGTVTLALGLVGGAYMAETIRAGIQAVPKGQMEAARSLGMSHARAMLSVVIPQAFRVILPPLTNELILLTKDSSLVYILGLSYQEYELTKFGREGMNTAANLTPIIVIGLCYLLITVPLSIVVRRLESRAERAR